MSNMVVNQYGDHPVYFGNVNRDVYMNSSGGSVDYLLQSLSIMILNTSFKRQ